MNLELDLSSSRAKKARLAQRIGKTGYTGLLLLTLCFGIVAAYGFVSISSRLGYAATALGLLVFMPALWYRLDLSKLVPITPAKRLDDIIDQVILAKLKNPITPQTVWSSVIDDGPALFFCNHLFISHDMVAQGLSPEQGDMSVVWQQAAALYQQFPARTIHSGTLAAALILSSPIVLEYLKSHKISQQDVLEVYSWLAREIAYSEQPKPYFGGVGRDWTAGFAVNLERFGQNMSQYIERGGGYAHFLAHNDVLDGVIHTLAQGNGVALIGPAGTGKTSLVYGLAERLLEGKDTALEYYQIVSLNASLILSEGAGKLENLMLTLLGESVHAGNVILFLDEAQLFFGHGVGAFDLSQLLLPIMQNHRLKIILAIAPNDWQVFRASSESLAGYFTQIIVDEPSAANTLKILEDTAFNFELKHKLIITYEAVREAYRLGNRYLQDSANPGKSINLLEQSIPYAVHKVLTAETIQSAIEKMHGVKVSSAQAPEAEVLLHMEDKIHERMVNQKRAVSVVAAALRRGRAGVSNPKRPIGSFLFLGPTGVGKTELARSLAAVYFGNERQMIRLDMSEYQQPEDVSRILSTSQSGEKNLLTSIREQPFTVVLLDELEKAHPNILNLLLQMLDEGQLTDSNGHAASFRSAIIIATSNAGSNDIAAQVKLTGTVANFERPLIDKLIKAGQFKAELINRFDEVVLFRPLNQQELGQVARLMLNDINKTLSGQDVSVQLTDAALEQVVKAGYDPDFGARAMQRMIQKTVEDAVAVKILSGQVAPGSTVTLDVGDLTSVSADSED